MKVSLLVGLGDTLTKHDFGVTDFQITKEKATMIVDGHRVELPWISNDVVWNHAYDNYYVASWGASAPPQEIRGIVGAVCFPGVPNSYYVELRLEQVPHG